MEKKLVGKVTHFFGKAMVAVIKAEAPIKVGDKLLFEGPNTNFEEEVVSMQVEHKAIEKAKKGDEIGMKVSEKVREKDLVYMI